MTDTAGSLRVTPLHALHKSLGAKMVPFAGYDMPVQYPTGILAEHLHCRSAASLFDVSHMGQIRLGGDERAAALETLVPGDMAGLGQGRTRYTLLTDDNGGILDDLMVTNAGDHLFLVVNAGTKEDDLARLKDKIAPRVAIRSLFDRALLALQGPQAAAVMARLAPPAAAMKFMTFAKMPVQGIDCWLTRSGYTGEDGYEISVAPEDVERLAQLLLDQPEVKPAGLGARDSLRLEAGLCLYGHDIDRTTTPVEADLGWAIAKRRRAQGGFPGAKRILDELTHGPKRLRVGILPEGKAPAREHTAITGEGGRALGEITSGGYGPTVGGPIAMGYVAREAAQAGTKIDLMVRGTARPAKIVPMPFVPHRYHRG